MKIFNKKIVATLMVALIASQLSFVYAKEWKAEDLSEDQQKAFITRDEFTTWVTAFTASLSEVDKNATQKIFDNMDFYDLQYKITIMYDYDVDAHKWYSDSIERPEGKYTPASAGGDINDQQKNELDAFRTDAVIWEKHRRGLMETPPGGGTWENFWNSQVGSGTAGAKYAFTKNPSYDPNYKY